MARERSPDRERAKKIWLVSGGTKKLKDISAELGLGETQIRKWKSQDKWDAEMKGNVTKSKSNVTKQGAPFGNKNAKGHGAPKGNQNAGGNAGGDGGPPGNKKAVTTGEHESIWADTLQDEERDLIGRIQTDPIQLLDEEISLLTIRERRMMQRVKNLMEGITEKQRRVLHQLRAVKEPVTVHDEQTGQTRTTIIQRDQLVVAEIAETDFRPIEDIMRIEEALTRVQDKKLKSIELKQKLDEAALFIGMKTEEQWMRIEKLKAEVKAIKGPDGEDPLDDGFLEALKGKAAEVWGNDGDADDEEA